MKNSGDWVTGRVVPNLIPVCNYRDAHWRGELHPNIIVNRMKREFSVQAKVGKPQVPWGFAPAPKRLAPGGRWLK